MKTAVLFHWKILPAVIRGFSWALRRTMGIGGAVGVSASANIFVGMVEAPLFVRPYLKSLTRSELFMVMSCGLTTVAGTVMVPYATILGPVMDNVLGHILTASLISAPASILIARLMVPEDGNSTKPTEADALVPVTSITPSFISCTTEGDLEELERLVSVFYTSPPMLNCWRTSPYGKKVYDEKFVQFVENVISKCMANSRTA